MTDLEQTISADDEARIRALQREIARERAALAEPLRVLRAKQKELTLLLARRGGWTPGLGHRRSR